ncbi:hypothetical protein NRIC_00380 [Enterococcus florum]|uniref:Uncharacterized protein n=1 Tax=Enterococcus florum TaxID=2480627 RepID=A0A4P5P352_9ENTE|nr:hypothetical protein [Enterococcus florum]GCF92147.1 hypothetical protein NRIC_00380 [Enterococcus florum]
MKISTQIKTTSTNLVSIFEFLKACNASSEELNTAIKKMNCVIAEDKFDYPVNLKFGKYVLTFANSSRATQINEIYIAKEKLEDYKTIYKEQDATNF